MYVLFNNTYKTDFLIFSSKQILFCNSDELRLFLFLITRTKNVFVVFKVKNKNY